MKSAHKSGAVTNNLVVVGILKRPLGTGRVTERKPERRLPMYRGRYSRQSQAFSALVIVSPPYSPLSPEGEDQGEGFLRTWNKAEFSNMSR